MGQFFSRIMGERYFENNLSDFAGQLATVSQEDLSTFISQILHQIIHQELDEKGCKGGLYLGLGGIAYALWYLSTKPHFVNQKDELLTFARKRIECHIKYSEAETDKTEKQRAAFLLGNSGLYMTAALICNDIGDQNATQEYLDKYASYIDAVVTLEYDEILVGRAGYLCGFLNLRQKLSVPIPSDEQLQSVCLSLLESGRKYSKEHQSDSPLMYAYYAREFLGAAHGLAGILQMLLSFPSVLERLDNDALSEVRRSVDFCLSVQELNANNLPPIVGMSDSQLVHWCHGAPGAIYLFARAYEVWQDHKYLDACIKCGDVIWHKGLLKKGPGVCHGVAGNAYAFLLLYRLTQDPKYLHRAHRFAEFMNSEQFEEARTPDNVNSLYEGLAGTICFYADLFEPEKSEFPLWPVIF